MTGWLRLARWSDWSTSKLPFLGAVALLLAPRALGLLPALAMLATVLFWAAFGYGINDVADEASDHRAGKANRAASLSPASRLFFLGLTSSMTLLLTTVWASDRVAPILVLAGLVLSAAYSLPPVRFKGRGAVGLVAGAVSQWLLPVLALSAVVVNGWTAPVTWCLGSLGLAIGIRWMAVHQLQDEASDRISGVQTYVTRGGSAWPILVGAFVLELALLSTTFWLTWPQSLLPAAVLAFWVAQQRWMRPRGLPFLEKLKSYDEAPLAEYYFLLLPLALALARASSSPTFLVIAALFVSLGWCYVSLMSGQWREVWGIAPRS